MGYNDFKEGDVVFLKIGSPAMIIDNKDAYHCYCLYLCNGEIKTIKVHYTSLTKEIPTI